MHGGADSDDGLSEADFEDVEHAGEASAAAYADIYAAEAPEHASAPTPAPAPAPQSAPPRIQVTITQPPPKARAGASPRDRQNRVLCHKLHVLCILAATRVRNRWCNDVPLREVLQDCVPTYLVNKLQAIHPRLVPERRERVRMFEALMHELVCWWARTFALDEDVCAAAAWRQPCMDILAGARPAPRTRVDGWIVESAGARAARRGGAGDAGMHIAIFPPGDRADVPTYLRLAPAAERLSTAAAARRGSREASAVLFCATCRSLGIPARLVVSVQAPPWSASGTRAVPEHAAAATAPGPPPGVRLRSSRAAAAADARAAAPAALDLGAPPTLWVEVYSKPYQHWLTVDPVRAFVRATGARGMEPLAADRQNRLVYVVAFEEDGFARDVTARYTRTLNTRVARHRLHGRDAAWWPRVVHALHRPQRLDRDAVEDAELADSAEREPMPTSVAAFKDHPVYALERHLRRDQVIYPAQRIGTFQGTPVYPRANVVHVQSARQWYNGGRVVREHEIPLKWVKARAYTLTAKRLEEQARADGADAQEPLYAYTQTALYVPPPVRDGRVPTNAFGHIDLFVPTMLPAGAAHIPYSGAAKIARQLGVSFAEATVGFEFRRFASVPRMHGIVVPVEAERRVLRHYFAAERAAAAAARARREEHALALWRRFVVALTVARHIREQYGGEAKGASVGRSEGVPEKRQLLPEGPEEREEEREEERQLLPPSPPSVPSAPSAPLPPSPTSAPSAPPAPLPPSSPSTSPSHRRIIPLEEMMQSAPKRRRIVLRRRPR